MHFDDRLATVLRFGATGERGARTQFRQLIDLLGAAPAAADGPMIDLAYERLAEVAQLVPAIEQSKILREPGQRLRNPQLTAWLARGEAQAAAAAMATARLGEEQWLDLIPRLPVNARGFLRHRRDLTPRVRDLLKRLGVEDLVLTRPEGEATAAEGVPSPPPAASRPEPKERAGEDGIRALVQRIEAFRQSRASQVGSVSPRLPLGEAGDIEETDDRPGSVDFATDATGRIRWADQPFAAMLVGISLAATGPGALARLDHPTRRELQLRQPLVNAKVLLEGAEPIAGEWRLDAAPHFTGVTGTFAGYRGRLRRPAAAAPAAHDGPADRMRQLLHELRTPVNAIQGYAEIIQQQMFGSAPNSYRALAAAVAVDGARLLAGFDEIERLARLETGAEAPDDGETDFRTLLGETIRRLEGALRPRNAALSLTVSGGPFIVPLAEEEAAQIAWRLLATLAGALAPGETIDLTLTSDGNGLRLTASLPSSLPSGGEVFSCSAPKQSQALTAGMFGPGFTLRLVRAEAAAAGGSLESGDDRLILTLPTLTGSTHGHRPLDNANAAAAGG